MWKPYGESNFYFWFIVRKLFYLWPPHWRGAEAPVWSWVISPVFPNFQVPICFGMPTLWRGRWWIPAKDALLLSLLLSWHDTPASCSLGMLNTIGRFPNALTPRYSCLLLWACFNSKFWYWILYCHDSPYFVCDRKGGSGTKVSLSYTRTVSTDSLRLLPPCLAWNVSSVPTVWSLPSVWKLILDVVSKERWMGRFTERTAPSLAIRHFYVHPWGIDPKQRRFDVQARQVFSAELCVHMTGPEETLTFFGSDPLHTVSIAQKMEPFTETFDIVRRWSALVFARHAFNGVFQHTSVWLFSSGGSDWFAFKSGIMSLSSPAASGCRKGKKT